MDDTNGVPTITYPLSVLADMGVLDDDEDHRASAYKAEAALADIAAQLHAHPDSLLTGEHGLAAATYRQAMMADEADGMRRDAEERLEELRLIKGPTGICESCESASVARADAAHEKVAALTASLEDLALQLGRAEGERDAWKMRAEKAERTLAMSERDAIRKLLHGAR